MKAKIKKTGEIIEVVPRANIEAQSSLDMLYVTNNKVYRGWELEFINVESKATDWEQRRYEIAKAVLQGIWANPHIDHTASKSYSCFASRAIMQADALINELKNN